MNRKSKRLVGDKEHAFKLIPYHLLLIPYFLIFFSAIFYNTPHIK